MSQRRRRLRSVPGTVRERMPSDTLWGWLDPSEDYLLVWHGGAWWVVGPGGPVASVHPVTVRAGDAASGQSR